MPDTAIGLMAKFPIEGEVKTRLAKDIGYPKALAVYTKLLNNATMLMRNLPGDRFFRTAFISPADKISDFKNLYHGFDQIYSQQGDDLGDRMLNALDTLLSVDITDRAILIGSDIPGIDQCHIEESRQLLDNADLVLGPTEDGGYYLIGLKLTQKALFSGIDWGTDLVFSQTLQKAMQLNLIVKQLPRLRDLDTIEDMRHFKY
ncbi:MAG: TIGR04282 family arsenosugar biosynthesis glycosyltransferase [candidate division Zixibacteria bacterium]|nr:TIGR04282 family arsenosugar biosynthesis glycosyltransferase [candidate division Zixibacteria bacterium]